MLPTNLPRLLRSEGLRVVEHDGWRKRGRPGYFAPVGVLCHHTATRATSTDEAVCRLLIVGRSDLPGPLCQIGLARDGTVHLIAAGRANHAGVAKASGTVAAGDGNTLYIGVEAFNDGLGEPWPAAQYDAYVTLAAALSKHVTGNSAQTVRGHKETSVTGKIDPRFDMDAFRRRVDTAMSKPARADVPPLTDEELTDMPDPRDFLNEPLNVHEPRGRIATRGLTVGEALQLIPLIAEQIGGRAGEVLDQMRQSPANKE